MDWLNNLGAIGIPYSLGDAIDWKHKASEVPFQVDDLESPTR